MCICNISRHIVTYENNKTQLYLNKGNITPLRYKTVYLMVYVTTQVINLLPAMLCLYLHTLAEGYYS